MGQKRKRPIKDAQSRDQQLRHQKQKKQTTTTIPNAAEISHPVISLYYRQVLTLRQYILQRIPRSSKSRRRRIAATRVDNSPGQEGLANLLDTTLVGVWKELSPAACQERRRDFVAFTQSHLTSQLAGTDTGPHCPQSEIVNYVIRSLFYPGGLSYQRPQHLLSHGFQHASGPYDNNAITCSIQGVKAQFPNKNVHMLKRAPWTEVLGLLGDNGEDIMSSLLLDCGLFAAVDAKKGVYCQISGLPLLTLEPIQRVSQRETICKEKISPAARSASVPDAEAKPNAPTKPGKSGEKNAEQAHNAIVFCRRRMLYARPSLYSNGRIELGLLNHVLNRFPSSESLSQTVHVLKYIFPRQFALHNVFTSEPNNRDSALSKNYSSREDEIAKHEELRRAQRQRRGSTSHTVEEESAKIPKRLRGKATDLVRQLQNRSKRCSYKELLRYYCPQECSGPWQLGPLNTQPDLPGSGLTSSISQPLVTQASVCHQGLQSNLKQSTSAPNTSTEEPCAELKAPKPKLNLTDYATPDTSVSAFCRAVIRKLVPPQFFGEGQHGTAHQKIVFGHIDRFIRMRRFESLSLHEVCKGIKITHIPWLEPQNSGQSPQENKISLSDIQKRRELFHEFIYYLFDSILMPLVRDNFYVTESQVHRNRLFYFRHDVWRRLTAEPLANLKSCMFEELQPEIAQRVLGRRTLGYGSLRLLPKTTGIRPILNLRRRMLVKTTWAGKTRHTWGASVNSTIAPIQSMLNYEKTRRADLLGSGMSSVGDIHSRLKAFKESLLARRGMDRQLPLYFVKLDIQSCFDTIPQQNLVGLIEKLVSEEAYHFMKYVEMRPGNEFNGFWPLQKPEQVKTRRKFAGRVASMANREHLVDTIAGGAGAVAGRRNTVFIDTIAQKKYDCEDLLDLLHEHVRNNLVKIGKKYFRQRNGIPQGSVLSSLLCNLFYADMEREVLGFLNSDEALLLRLVDDFLLVTLDPDLAMRFLRVMLKGQPRYGISVNPAKSLVNFAASVEGSQIPRLVETSLFPYCGSLIDTRTLEIFKDQDRILDGAESVTAALSDSLTIESTRAPGRSFHRKVLASVKLSMHPMYLDTAHNSVTAVLSNLYTTFFTSAMKMYRYTKSLPAGAQPTPEVVVRTIRDVTQLGYRLIRAKREQSSSSRALCTVSYPQMQYLGAAAFQFVLGRKQTRYGCVLRWLDDALSEARPAAARDAALLAQVVQSGNSLYGGWRF